MEKSKFKISVVGVIVFACAFMLNIQTNLDGELSVFSSVIAQSDGSGGDGSGGYGNGLYGQCVECYNDPEWVSIVCYEATESYCIETGCTSGFCDD